MQVSIFIERPSRTSGRSIAGFARRAVPLLLVLLAAILPLVAAATEDGDQGPAVLERRCLACHGPTTSMGELDLSNRETALRGGTRGPALVPEEPENSLILARVVAGEMPPAAPLSEADKHTLRTWIADGAVWPGEISERRAGNDWWSLQPLRESASPPVQARPAGWSASPVDRWILAGLEAAGLQPSPEAERRILIRRLNYALLGLPPTPEEVQQFVQDSNEDAYERLVDRLLASPHYGERWARHWLDLVRFAESEGFERDLQRDHAWPYRDYVIRSLNDDKSYLQFAREQLAGDVIEPVTRDGIVATTMLALGPVDGIGLTSAVLEEREQVREDYLEEMVGTVTQTFLGLTVNCARCHDHKFDPIAQEEYYRIKAAFQAIWPPTLPITNGGLDEFFPFGLPVLTPDERIRHDSRIDALDERMEEVADTVGRLYRGVRPESVASSVPQPRARWTFDVDGRADHEPLHLRLDGNTEIAEGRMRLRRVEEDPDGDKAGDKNPPKPVLGVAASSRLTWDLREKTLEVWLHVDSEPTKLGVPMEIRGQSGFRGAPLDGIMYVAEKEPRWQNFSVGSFRTADVGGPAEKLEAGDQVQIAIAFATDGTISIFRNGKLYGERYQPDPGSTAGRLQLYGEDDSLLRFSVTESFSVREARLYDTALPEAAIDASFQAGIQDWTEAELKERMDPLMRARIAGLQEELRQLRKERGSVSKPQLAHAAQVRAMEPTHVLIRGAVNRKGPVVEPAGLACVPGVPADLGLAVEAGEGERRRAIAKWIANPDNPLFSRVMVNRVWQYHFGQGLATNPSDLGFNGGEPSHPELLDWLAAEFAREGWSLKRLHKRILMSRAYRQSSRWNADAAAVDTDNRLVWRYTPRRLTGEDVRDSMLAVSGDLNLRVHGPSFRPFDLGTQVGSLRRYELTTRDTPDLRRRTVYRMNTITGGDPMLEALDCPLPAVKAPKRPSTTTAIQALSLMNNAFVQHRAEGFAARVQQEGATLDSQIERAFSLAFGRLPDTDELVSSRAMVDEHGWESLSWGILNTSEFLYVR